MATIVDKRNGQIITTCPTKYEYHTYQYLAMINAKMHLLEGDEYPIIEINGNYYHEKDIIIIED